MRPRGIVIHCSASRWGDAAAVDTWHRARGWSQIGYHGVILNGHRTYGSAYERRLDGKIEPGRPENMRGAHCAAGGMNPRSLGVCLIGIPGWDDYPTGNQIGALIHYCFVKCRQYGIPVEAIYQHSDFEAAKPLCASIDLGVLRALVAAKLSQVP